MPPGYAHLNKHPRRRGLCPGCGREHFDRRGAAVLRSPVTRKPSAGTDRVITRASNMARLPQTWRRDDREERGMTSEGVADHRPDGETASTRSSPPRRSAWSRRCSGSSAAAAPSCWPPGPPGSRSCPPARCWTSCPAPGPSGTTRTGGWPRPRPGLVDRRVEITGPTDRKMTINALNSGANVWLADFEDANTPLWENMITGQLNLIDALDRTIDFTSDEGKSYRLGPGQRAGHDRGPAARLAPGREARAGGRRSGSPAACSTSRCTSATARGASWTRAPGRTSTCPRSRATWRPGSGTTRSTWPRTAWASRAARSGPRC